MVFHGRRFRINIEPTLDVAALTRYLAAQGRFRGAALDIAHVAASIREQWADLRRRAAPDEVQAGVSDSMPDRSFAPGEGPHGGVRGAGGAT